MNEKSSSAYPLIMSGPNEIVEVVRNLFLQKENQVWPYSLALGTILKIIEKVTEKESPKLLVTDGNLLFWIDERLARGVMVRPKEKGELSCRGGGCSQCGCRTGCE